MACFLKAKSKQRYSLLYVLFNKLLEGLAMLIKQEKRIRKINRKGTTVITTVITYIIQKTQRNLHRILKILKNNSGILST